MSHLLSRLVLVVFAIVAGAMLLNSTAIREAGATQKSGARRTRRAPRKPALPTGISNGVRITVQAVESAGKTFASENASLEANEGEEILVLHITFFRSRTARDKSEVTFAQPGLLLKEGQEGQTNLSKVTFYQEPDAALEQQMQIPFLVPEGAELVALTIGDAALDLTKIEVTEASDGMGALQSSVQEAIKQREDRERLDKIIKQSNADRERMRDLLKPVPTPYPKIVIPPDFKVPRIESFPSPTPSPSPES